MAILDNKLNQLNQKCDENSDAITDTQIAVTENYEKTLEADHSITDIQLAIVELYEMNLGGQSNG